MPAWIRGIGKTYRNKQNTSRIESICEPCGQLGWLDSFDAREWFVLFFLPVAPLKRYRVLDQCRACRHHQRFTEAEFAALKKAELEPFQIELEHDPGSVETRLRMADALARLRLFREAEAVLEDGAQRTASPGALHFRMGELRAARADSQGAALAFRNAVNTGGVPMARRELGRALLLCGESGDAARELEAARLASPRDGDTLWLLARAYDKLGRSAEASPLLAQLRAIAPELAEGEDFLAITRRAEAAELSGPTAEKKAGWHLPLSPRWRQALTVTVLGLLVCGGGFLAYQRLQDKDPPAPSKGRNKRTPASQASRAPFPAEPALSPAEQAEAWIGLERDADAWRSLDEMLTQPDSEPGLLAVYARAAVGAGKVLPARARLGELETTAANRLALLEARWILVLAGELWDEADAMIDERVALADGDKDAAWPWRAQLERVRGNGTELERLLDQASETAAHRPARLEVELDVALGARRWADAATFAGALAAEQDTEADRALFGLYQAAALLAAGDEDAANTSLAALRDDLPADTDEAHAITFLADQLVNAGDSGSQSKVVLTSVRRATGWSPHASFLLALKEISRGEEQRARPHLEHAMSRALEFKLPYGAARQLAELP